MSKAKRGSRLGGEQTRISHTSQERVTGPKDASLVQIYGPSLGERYVIDKNELRIGRDRSNQVVLDADNVSRVHARLVLDKDRVVLEDLDSTNGTLVNDEETSRTILKNGDLIKIGSVMLKFISSGNAEALYHEAIYKMTIEDGLTAIPNRRFFEDFLERELARAVRYERPLSLAIFDIDHFKKINDTYGHLAGDYVLRKMAGKIRTTIRREELLARYGGEEFVIVMPETTLDKARHFADKIRDLVENTEFEFDNRKLEVTISVGVTERTSNIASPHEFIHRADSALYEAKASGRNRVVTA